MHGLERIKAALQVRQQGELGGTRSALPAERGEELGDALRGTAVAAAQEGKDVLLLVPDLHARAGNAAGAAASDLEVPGGETLPQAEQAQGFDGGLFRFHVRA